MNKFIKVLSFVNILLLSFTLCSCSSSSKNYIEKYKSFQTLNHDDKVSKMKEEVEFMCEKLEKKHKNLYHSISKEEFKEKEDQIISELPHIKSESEYYLALSELITSLKDAHTRVLSNDLVSNEAKYYGFDVRKFEDSWILTGIDTSNQDKLGYEVKAINNVDINEIYNDALNFSSHENPYVFTNEFPSYVKTAYVLSKIKVINSICDENIFITLADKSGQEINISVPSVEYDNLKQLILLSSKAEPMETDCDEDKFYWSKELSDDSYYIQYNQCSEDSSFKINEFTSEVTKDIEENNFKKVIIDLRYNGGGDSRVIKPLYDEIQKLKDPYKFKVYILIGNDTFSSALLNAYDGKQQLDATLAGQPTGGNLNHYGEVEGFNLPYSGFSVTYCVKYFENVKGYDKDALYPDIECAMKLDDYLNGVDTVVQAVIKD